MKTLNTLRLGSLILAAVTFFALPKISQATVINITIDPATGLPASDIDFGLLPNNNPTSNFNALATNVGLYEAYSGTSLPDPIFSGFANFENINGNSIAIDITGYDYAVLHYGKGPGGLGKGGSIVFDYLGDMTGTYLFPGMGSGPNGFGGLSSIRLFMGEPNEVPDSGTTIALLGASLIGIDSLRRRLKR
jgi:hypothetical protein